MNTKLRFPGFALWRARVYAKMGATARAVSLLKRILEENPASGDALVSLVALYRRNSLTARFDANQVCLDFLDRNAGNQQAPGLVLSLLNFTELDPVATLTVCEEIAGRDHTQRPTIHNVYAGILAREAPAPPMDEEAMAQCGSAGYWPPSAPTLGEEREIYLIHASVDDGNELAAIDHLQRASAWGHTVTPVIRAYRRFRSSECGRRAEGHYPELASRMAELEMRQARA